MFQALISTPWMMVVANTFVTKTSLKLEVDNVVLQFNHSNGGRRDRSVHILTQKSIAMPGPKAAR